MDYSTVPGYSLFQEGKVTILTDINYEGSKPQKVVKVWVDKKEYANFDGDEDNLCKVIVRGASVREGVLTVNTAVIDFEEPGVTHHRDYRHDVQTGAYLGMTETAEYDGGEPGSTILSYTTLNPDGDILKTGREVIYND